jgi:hypothetical protein
MTPGGLRAGAVRIGFVVFLAGCSRREPPPPPPPPPPAQVDKDLLESAMHQCFTVDCESAHSRAGQISTDSPLRSTDDFRAIEFRYEVDQLLHAEAEPDVDKRRALLDQFRQNPNADADLRTAAAERLARLGSGQRFELRLVPDGGADGGADGGSSDAAEIAKLMRTKKPTDYQAARLLIEPRIYSGTASPDDIKAMTIICKAQKDNVCLKTLKTLKLH